MKSYIFNFLFFIVIPHFVSIAQEVPNFSMATDISALLLAGNGTPVTSVTQNICRTIPAKYRSSVTGLLIQEVINKIVQTYRSQRVPEWFEVEKSDIYAYVISSIISRNRPAPPEESSRCKKAKSDLYSLLEGLPRWIQMYTDCIAQLDPSSYSYRHHSSGFLWAPTPPPDIDDLPPVTLCPKQIADLRRYLGYIDDKSDLVARYCD